MAKYKAYPEYKDSGVEWLGEIPRHWQRFPLKYLVEMKSGESITAADIEPEGNYPVFGGNGLRGYSSKYTHSGSYILIGRQGALCGNVNYAHNQFWASEHALVVKGKKSFNIRWLGELLRAMNLNQYSITAAQPGLSAEALVNLQIPVPPEAEREAVASFIDYEAGKIDNLIEKQQQLIELLKEKRQAVISHAVTKGLNPDVPMKDSGVEWLGDVPKHWDVCAIKHIVSTPITDGPHETPDFIDDGIPFISAEAISSGVIDFDKKRACISIKDHKRFSKKYSPQFNDIYMVKSGATTGITAIVETYDDFNIWSPLAVIRCNDYSNPYFVINFMRSKPFQTAIELNWSYGTQQNIGMGVIGNLHIARPPVSEAIEIATYLRAKCSKFDELIDIAMMQISIMQERRTALISAAVTGKIDVRDWVAPDTQDVEAPQEATA
ncbi:restriction endonuclease subunit S [Citrobacter sp. BNK-39]|uniref:restriction endonuclease subunit S n=1 Tax=Citrobacter TaxID=544 RepID=UPI00314000EB